MGEHDRAGRRLTRRRFLIGTVALAGGGLALAWLRDGDERIDPDAATLEPNAWLQLRPDGAIILQVDKLEMGQGVMTGFATLVAEELDVRPDSITLRHAPVHPRFFDPSQTTGDSQSMRRRWAKLREVGATAREMLLEAAAARWEVPRGSVESDGAGGIVNRETGARSSYAGVVEAAARLAVPDSVELKTPDAFRYIGARVARPDAPDKVTGSTTYGFDLALPGQLTAVVARPPALGGRALHFDAARARGMPGVRHVVEIGAGIAVVADSFWQAHRAASELDVEWAGSRAADMRVAAIHAGQRAVLDSADMINVRDDGDVDAAFAAADRVVEAEYAQPFLAHATMEPMNATVRVGDGRCDLWAASQSPDMTREIVAAMTGLAREAVHVHVLPAGGGFGRRIVNDCILEATEIAMRVGGPVRLLWTREDDIRHDRFHPPNLTRMRAALDGSGRPTAWEHRLVVPNTGDELMPDVIATVLPEWVPDAVHRRLSSWLLAGLERFFGPVQGRDGSRNMPYAFDHVRVDVQGYPLDVPVGIWRSVGNHFNAFAVECFVDELAGIAGEDPLEFRRARLAGQPRHRAVLDRLAAESGWGSPPGGRFQGAAIHAAYDSVVGQVAEISVGSGGVRVHRVTCVVDCGVAINPDIVRQQMESGIVFGMTAALYGEIDFDDGRVRQSNFHDYPMVRMADSPQIDVHILEGAESPGGVGEAGTPPIAPAIANAVFAATGQRIRRLPIRLGQGAVVAGPSQRGRSPVADPDQRPPSSAASASSVVSGAVHAVPRQT